MRTKKYFPRNLMEDLKKWINRKEIYLIKGPHQAGKTSILKMLRRYLIKEKQVNPKNAILLTLEDRETLAKFSASPQDFIRSYMSGRENERFYFFLDEIQYLPDAGQKIKLLYDLFENIKFIVTGLLSKELSTQISRFLVGRMFFFYLPQYSFSEFIKYKSTQLDYIYKQRAKEIKDFIISDKDFSLDKDIYASDFKKLYEEYTIYGGYPEVIKSRDSKTKETILKNIYESNITKNTPEFRIILNLLASRISTLIEYNSLCTETNTHFKLLKHYLSVLEETQIISLLKPFYTTKTAELKKSPKIYFLDTGLRNYAINNFNNLDFSPDAAALIENTAFIQLKINYPKIPLKYWRTLGKAKVDFILYKDKKPLPIDIKYANISEPKITRGYRNFIHSYKPKKALILTRGFCGELNLSQTKIKFLPVWYI